MNHKHNKKRMSRTSAQQRKRGFTLVELMIALLLGLIVVAGVVGVFGSNQQAYRSNQAVGEVQDGSRAAFELMARDIRSAATTGCYDNGRVVNVLKNGPYNGGTDWWADWSNALRGYASTDADPAIASITDSSPPTHVTGTDSFMLLEASDRSYSVASDSNEPTATATFTLNESSSELQSGDVVITCDPDHAAIFQITGSGTSFTHPSTGSELPGNCAVGLGYPTTCGGANSYDFAKNSQAAKLNAVDWFVGEKSGIKSLYRIRVDTSTDPTTTAITADEMVRNVSTMTVRYHVPGATDFQAASAITDWSLVDALQVSLTLNSTDTRIGTNNNASGDKSIQRSFTAITMVRNRVQ
jgi:type IV pilus assembly protein PilW